MAEISGFYVACCDCMGRNSGKLPGSGQERFLIRDINVCTKVKVACYLATRFIHSGEAPIVELKT
jgi:hypothetical protein